MIAGKAARLLHRGEPGVVVPVGLILVASIAVVWDFSTSGLEMGLVWLWIATAWYVLVVGRATPTSSTRAGGWFCGALLGLGPLVRPDLTLMLLCFGVAWFALVRPRRIVFDLVAMLALPVLVRDLPHGLLRDARAVDRARQGRGRTARRPGLGLREELHRAVPTLAHCDLGRGHDRATARERTPIVVSWSSRAAMLTAGLVHALYITAIGGDYMHGRLLLPALFALALPASLAVTRRSASVGGDQCRRRGVGDRERRRFRPPPNTVSYLLSPISDWRAVSGAKLKPTDAAFGLNGNQAAAAYERGVRGYFKLTDKTPRPASRPRGRSC